MLVHFICKKLDFILEICITLLYYESWFYKSYQQPKWLFSEVVAFDIQTKNGFCKKNFNTWCAMCKEYISCFKRISLVLSTRYYWEFSDLNIWLKMFLWYIVNTCLYDMCIVFVHQYPVWKYYIFLPIQIYVKVSYSDLWLAW